MDGWMCNGKRRMIDENARERKRRTKEHSVGERERNGGDDDEGAKKYTRSRRGG